MLSRIATTAVEVIGRQRSFSAIAAFEPKVTQMAEQYRVCLNAIKPLKVSKNQLLAESRLRFAALQYATQAWIATLSRDIPGFERGELLVPADGSLDAIANAEGVVEVVETKGSELPYAGELIGQLQPLIETARTGHEAAQTARVALQAKQAEARTLGLALHRDLVLLRRALRAVLGSSHIDYQRLRIPRGRFDAEPPVPTVGEAVAPSNGVTTTA